MSLHNDIMNLICKEPEVRSYGAEPHYAYKLGHRDARHAAAELSLKADERIDELVYALRAAKAYVEDTSDYGRELADAVTFIIDAALEENK